jgi:hypothetical protein
VRLSVHQNDLVVNLMAQPDNTRRLQRHSKWSAYHTLSVIVLFVVWSLISVCKSLSHKLQQT